MAIIWRNRLTFIKDPEAVLDYVLDWTNWLDSADTISAVAVTGATGITVDSSSSTTTSTTAWVSGGTEGNTYAVTFHITTAAGRETDRTIYLRIKDL